MIVDFDGDGEKWREERLTRVFCALPEQSRIKIRKMSDHEGYLTIHADGVDARFCADIQTAWEFEHEYSFEVSDVKHDGYPALRYKTL